MNEFEVWEEGYAISGNRGKAKLLGKVKAHAFREACCKMFHENNMDLFDRKNLTICGCRLFDNEQDARKDFG